VTIALGDEPELAPPVNPVARLATPHRSIITFTGRRVCPTALEPDDVCIEDIAHHLSLVNRFTGATREPYSVAQHSVLCALYVSSSRAEDQLWALLHDASEAYVTDLNRAVKHDSALAGYRFIEAKVQRLICCVFDLPPVAPPCVKDVDDRLLIWEQRDLMHPNATAGKRIDEPHSIVPWTARVAEEQFLSLFARLDAKRRAGR
jgi:uncharacterized protein